MRKLLAIGVATLALSACRDAVERERIDVCEQMIEAAARWGVIEIKSPDRSTAGYLFDWERGSIVLQNGFGAHIPASASCIHSIEGDPTRLWLTTPTGVATCTMENTYPRCD